jgi:clan AA aspartic protease (TIGR02281 family)
MSSLIYLLVLLGWTVLVPLTIRQYRKGRTVAGGVVRITKLANDTVFESQVRLNGKKVTGLFDTGASETTIGIDLAKEIGFEPTSLNFDTSTDTAAGMLHAAIAKVYLDEFQVGSIVVRNMGIGVNRYVSRQCLVGMNFFETLDSFEISGNVLTLRKATGDKIHDSTINGRERPRQTASEPRLRVNTDCPYCTARMNLPAGRKGKVRCHSCDRLFLADTKVGEDSSAHSEPFE